MEKITETVCVPVKLQIVTTCAEEACFPSGIDREKGRERERDGRMRRGKGQGKSKWQWQGKHARKEEEDKRKVYCYGPISYVGVIWFFFMFTNFYQLDLHNKTKPVLHS